MNELTKTSAREEGLCCQSCKELVNIHCCKKCDRVFSDGDIIYCEHHSQEDCMHYHEDCKPEEVKSNQ